MADEKLTWREVEDAWERGEETETIPNGFRYRVRDGILQCAPPVGPECWLESRALYAQLRSMEWRRVPKTPRVHELPEKWRGHKNFSGVELSLLRCLAGELDAAIAADDLVSLKGVTAEELKDAYRADAQYAYWESFVLDYLRKRTAKP